jgi:uncharacterized protein (TIGR03435 family)
MKQLGPASRSLLIAALAAALIMPIAFGVLGVPEARAQIKQEDTAVPGYLSVTISTDGFSAEIRHNTSHMMTSNATPLRKQVAFAYGVDDSLVLGGPDWIDQRIYYIVGRVDPETAQEADRFAAWRARDKAMLADRFSLIVHSETRQLPAYVLTADAGGKNLTPIPEAPKQNHRVQVELPPGQSWDNDTLDSLTKIRGEAASMQSFTQTLARMMGQPVLDRTGLTGNFDFEVTRDLNASTLVGALHDQLGLTLKSSVEPMDVIVVDHIQRPTLDPISQPAWHFPL